MPSGARKRKAAAKKKQVKVGPTPPFSATSSTQGDEDLKHLENDDDHNSDGEDGVEKSTGDVKNGDVQVEKATDQDDGGVQAEGGPKLGVEFDEKKGDSSSNSSSSDSDDGSREAEKKITIEENAPVDVLVEANVSMSDGPVEMIHTAHVTKSEDPLAECVTEVGEENILVPDEKVPVYSGATADISITPDVAEKGQAKLSSAKENSGLPEVAKELAPEDKDEETASLLEDPKDLAPDEESAKLPEVTTELASEDKDEENDGPIVVAKEQAPDEQSAGQPEVPKEPAPDNKEDENASPLEVAKELEPCNVKYENIDAAATSSATESAVKKNEEKLTLSYNAKGVDTTKDFGNSQASVIPVVRPGQSTSWKSCCGLFEALTGTSR